ncbi:MAG TPA: hypothetical protein VHT52_17465 [Stellaceae bacterium]|jgi:hypothetical protein|nr:hypothetical protein [Stellaceae bacterium]
MPYANRTQVPVDKTRLEIERLVRKYGATGFGSAWQDTGKGGGKARVEFVCHNRHIRMTVDIPPYEQKARGRWRVLMLMVKAKLVAVDAEVITFEEAFFADIVMPETNKTVYEMAREPVRLSYEQRKDQPLLGGSR